MTKIFLLLKSPRNMAHQSEFSVQEVIQFTLIANDQELACILRELAANPRVISTVAYLQVLLKDGCSLVKIVPGVSGVDGQIIQEASGIIALRSILESNCVNYEDNIVLNVAPTNVDRIQALLSGVDNDVLSAYLTQAGSIIYEVCDNELATVVLKLPKAEQDILIKETLVCKEKKCRKIVTKKCRPNCGKKCHKKACCPSVCSSDTSDSSCCPSSYSSSSCSSEWHKKKPHYKPIHKPTKDDTPTWKRW